MNVEAELERYGRELAERDRAGTLLTDADPVGQVPPLPRTDGRSAGDPATGAPSYVEHPEPRGTSSAGHRRVLWGAAAAVIAVAAIVGTLFWREEHTTSSVDEPTASTMVETTAPTTAFVTTTTTAPPVPAVQTPLEPYPLEPASASDRRALVQGDAYAVRYRAQGHEFLLLRSATALPPTPAIDEEGLNRFLDGRGTAVPIEGLGTVHITCGDSGQMTDDADWKWSSAAVGYWIQDGYLVSLSLIGEAPEVSFLEDGTAIGPGGAAGCPAPDMLEPLEVELAQVRAVDRADLDAALDAMPLTIGKYGRNIPPPRSEGG